MTATVEYMEQQRVLRDRERLEESVRTKLISRMTLEEARIRQQQLDAEDATFSGESKKAARQNLAAHIERVEAQAEATVAAVRTRLAEITPLVHDSQTRMLNAEQERIEAWKAAVPLRREYDVLASMARRLGIEFDFVPAGEFPPQLVHEMLSAPGGRW